MAASGAAKSDASEAAPRTNPQARERLEAMSSGYRDRLGDLLSSGKLSREEAATVLEASADFESLIARMDSALAGGAEPSPKMQRAFDHALNELRANVNGVISAENPPIAMQNMADVTSDVKSVGASGRANADVPVDTSQISARLSAAFKGVDERLANIAQMRGQDGGAEIQDLQDRFGQLITRLESAVENGLSPDALDGLVQRMMSALRDGVAGGGMDQPMMYDAKSAAAPITTPGSANGLDTLG